MAIAVVVISCGEEQEIPPVDRGHQLFADGHCAEAMQEFDPLIETGTADGRVLFEAQACLVRSGGEQARIDALRDKAMETLQEAIQGEGAEVVDYHYLAELQYMAGLAAEGGETGVEAIRKFPRLQELVDPPAAPEEEATNPPAEAGDTVPADAFDYFHFARIYDLLHRQDLSMQFYLRAATDFEQLPDPPTAWFAMSLAEAARAELDAREFEAAAAKIDRARQLMPDITVDPMVEGLAMMGARRYGEAEAAWGQILEPADLVLECQMRAALAKKAKRFKKLPKKGPTGLPLAEYSDEELETAILELVEEMREYRETFIPGWRIKADSPANQLSSIERDTLLKGMRRTESKFLALHLEYLLRGHSLQPFANRNGYPKLLRY